MVFKWSLTGLEMHGQPTPCGNSTGGQQGGSSLQSKNHLVSSNVVREFQEGVNWNNSNLSQIKISQVKYLGKLKLSKKIRIEKSKHNEL